MDKKYPYLISRIQSTLIDLLFLVLLMYLVARTLNSFEAVPEWVRGVSFFAIWALYEPIAVSLGCTIGQFFLKLRVKQHTNPSKRINFFQAFIRYIVKTFLGWISFLTINSNKEKRAIHDMATGSVMIRV